MPFALPSATDGRRDSTIDRPGCSKVRGEDLEVHPAGTELERKVVAKECWHLRAGRRLC